jgi:predicted ATPase
MDTMARTMPPEICRKLDGIALAIELAAGRAAIFGDELSEASDRRESAARGPSWLVNQRYGRLMLPTPTK